MARTLRDLAPGTRIFIDELNGETYAIEHIPYICLGMEENKPAARVMRQHPIGPMVMEPNPADKFTYENTQLDTWLNNGNDGFLIRFVDWAIRGNLIPQEISYARYNSTTKTYDTFTIQRSVYVPSYTEVGADTNDKLQDGVSFLDALKAFTGQTADKNARIAYTKEGTAVNYWLRSSEAYVQRCTSVDKNGNVSATATTRTDCYTRPVLALNPDLPVSDEGAPAIFLLPEGRDTYWYLSAKMSLGQTKRGIPMKCKLIIPGEGMAEMACKVCNNYVDETPNWVACENGGVAELGKEKTADNWELGVEITAKAQTPESYIRRPILITEEVVPKY